MDDNNAKNARQPVPMTIQLDEAVAQGAYSNLVMINHSETEYVFDFIFVQPQQPKAKVLSRVITSPKHAKRLLHALQENMQRYEEKFGVIDVSPSAGLITPPSAQFH